MHDFSCNTYTQSCLIILILFCCFQRYVGHDAVMPLSSSTHGIRVEPLVTKGNKPFKFKKTASKLYIYEDFYEFLSPGPNDFYCRASNSLAGISEATQFVIYKME